MDERIVVVSWQLRVLGLDVHDHWVMVQRQPDLAGPIVVQVRECHLSQTPQTQP